MTEPHLIRPSTPVTLPELLDLLKRLQWSATTQGAPLGSMATHSLPGPQIPACPSCGGVHPEKGRNEFQEGALGHRTDCELRDMIMHLQMRGIGVTLQTVAENEDLQLPAPLLFSLHQQEHNVLLTLGHQEVARLRLDEEGDVLMQAYGPNDGAELVIYEGKTIQTRRDISDLEEGEVLDIGEHCLYTVRSMDERGDVLHLILEGDDAVWHLQCPSDERLVRSQEQEGTWALEQSAVDTDALKQLY